MAHILIVEDNARCAELAHVAGGALGHVATVAAGPWHALALANTGRYDVALVAHAHGPELVAALRARAPGLAILVTTPQPLAIARADFRGAGVGFLPKPFVVGVLAARLDATLAA
jgi:DNA-binding response OmpR family regulator